MTIWRGPRHIWRGPNRYQLVGLATLGVLAFGAYTYYPYGYVSVAAPLCDGVTDDGCRLTWRDVPLEEGGVEPQCVQWCPQGYEPPAEPAAVAAPVAVATPAVGQGGGCELTGYADPQLQGVSFTTGESFPTLDQWKNQIGSVRVAAGTWDFYSDENFGGEVMRLNPGEYPNLGDDWTYAIGSFMCVSP